VVVCVFERSADRVCVEDAVPLDDLFEEAESDADPLLVFESRVLTVGDLVKYIDFV
jgi:hypothetical protein